jgi:hypothetical protein
LLRVAGQDEPEGNGDERRGQHEEDGRLDAWKAQNLPAGW